MTTLYRPNHRLNGPMESNKHLTSGSILLDGLSTVKDRLDQAYEIWDQSTRNLMQGRPGLVQGRATVLDWHGPSGSFLRRARDVSTGEKRVDVVPVISVPNIAAQVENCDAIAIGVGSLPSSLNSEAIQQIKSLIGRTRLIIGRLLLPYLEDCWDELGIFITSESGESGNLIQEGWDPPLARIENPRAASRIPDDGLAADNAPILNGSGAHRFYLALAGKTMILGLGIGIGLQIARSEELQWTYEAIQQWLAPSLPSIKPIWASN